jgi:hypothetical protein
LFKFNYSILYFFLNIISEIETVVGAMAHVALPVARVHDVYVRVDVGAAVAAPSDRRGFKKDQVLNCEIA